jgi:ComF family protein
VPLHPDRQRERGFNQSDLLAHAMADPLGLSVRADLLQRVRPTRPQVGLARQERLQNVADAFRARPEVEGGRWLLVDDVCTTSATLEACAQALRLRGAGAVWAITLARPQGAARDVLASEVDGP